MFLIALFAIGILLINAAVNNKLKLINKNIKEIAKNDEIESKMENKLSDIYENGFDLFKGEISVSKFGGKIVMYNPIKRMFVNEFYTKYNFYYSLYYGNPLNPFKLKNVQIEGGISLLGTLYPDYDSEIDLINKTNEKLPKIDTNYIEKLLLFYKALDENKNFTAHENSSEYFSERDKIEISGRHYFRKSVNFGKNTNITDAIIISNDSVILKNNCNINNSTLMAENIFIENESHIKNCEIIVLKNLFGEKHSNVENSDILLIALTKDNKIEHSSVKLMNKSSFSGNVLLIPQNSKNLKDRNNIYFYKGKDVQFNGNIMNYGISECYGKINGSIYSYDFRSQRKSHTIENLQITRRKKIDNKFLFGIAGETDYEKRFITN